LRILVSSLTMLAAYSVPVASAVALLDRI